MKFPRILRTRRKTQPEPGHGFTVNGPEVEVRPASDNAEGRRKVEPLNLGDYDTATFTYSITFEGWVLRKYPDVVVDHTIARLRQHLTEMGHRP